MNIHFTNIDNLIEAIWLEAQYRAWLGRHPALEQAGHTWRGFFVEELNDMEGAEDLELI